MCPKEVEFPPLYRLLKVDVAPQNRSTSQLLGRLGLEGYFDTFKDKNKLLYELQRARRGLQLLDLGQILEALNGCLTYKINDL